jgi:anti-sigma B factor antagonist
MAYERFGRGGEWVHRHRQGRRKAARWGDLIMMSTDGARTGYEDDDTLGNATVSFARLTTGSSCVLQVCGDLDIAVSADLFRELEILLEVGGEHVAIDLSGVAFIDSSALSALVHAHTRAKERRQQLTLLRPSPACEKVLNITGLDRVFRIG